MASPVTPGAIDTRLILPNRYSTLEQEAFDWGLPGHLISLGAPAPQLGALQTNITSQTLVAGSTDIQGSITLVTSATATVAGGALCQIVFSNQYAGSVVVMVTPTASSTTWFGPVVINKTVAGFTIANGTVIVPVSTTVTIDYITMGS